MEAAGQLGSPLREADAALVQLAPLRPYAAGVSSEPCGRFTIMSIDSVAQLAPPPELTFTVYGYPSRTQF